MVGYREARRPELQTSVLRRLEGAAGEAEERGAGDAFLDWVEAEGLIMSPGSSMPGRYDGLKLFEAVAAVDRVHPMIYAVAFQMNGDSRLIQSD
jgi:hypothetical protein